MDPISLLMDEHRWIEQLLNALDQYVTASPEDIDPKDLGQFVRVIKGFADACHHGKEENILFEAMVAYGFPSKVGPIGVMLHEHDEGRRQVAVLAQAADSQELWTEHQRGQVMQAARSYSVLLRQHIQKEDMILYPMAQSRLPEETLQAIETKCEAFEKENAQTRDSLQAIGDQLMDRYSQVDCSMKTTQGCQGCCCG